LVFVVCGPSGSGKSTLLEALLEREPKLRFSVSMTTRAPRAGEADGRDYFFVDPARFQAAREAGELLEWAEVHGQLYGTPRGPLERQREAGQEVVLDIDVQGAAQVREKLADAIFIFVQPPSLAVLEERLRARGTESAEQIARRLQTAQEEFRHQHEFDYLVVNEDLQEALADLQAIVRAERCRVRSSGQSLAKND